MINLIDTHAHLDMLEHDPLPIILTRAETAGLRNIITVGSSVESSRQAVDLAQEYPFVYAAVGLHPEEAAGWKAAASELERLSREPKVVAIGEIGLDYHYPETDIVAQKKAFAGQLNLAVATALPVMIHCRDAYQDMLEVVRQWRPRLSEVIIHCFSGSPDEAGEFIAMDCYISFAGQVTFKNRGVLADVVALVPVEKMLLETDCPYLTPHPKRGTPNEPANVALTAQAIADIKNMDLEELAGTTTGSARSVFGI